jgi:L-idonate 5-dehydrogenase
VYAAIHCLGCAARTPHVQGGFAQHVAAPDSQIRAPPRLDLRSAVSAEPPSVALHAVVETTELSANAA